jgi:hypothetical protein
MVQYIRYSLLLIFLALIGCQANDGSKTVQNKETIQSDIELLLPEVAKQMDSIVELANSISVQGRTLTKGEIELVARIEGLRQPWDSWQKNYTQFKSLHTKNALSEQDQTIFLKKLLTQLQSLSEMATTISI